MSQRESARSGDADDIRTHVWEYDPDYGYAGGLRNRWICTQCRVRRMIRSNRPPGCRPDSTRPFLPSYRALTAEVAAYRAMLAEFA